MAKSKIFALVLIFAAIGVAAGTGAFTTAEADRTAEVNVAGDANALLGIEEATNTNGNEFVTTDGETGQVVMNLSGVNSSRGGVNADAATDLGNVLNLTNNGEETIQVKVELSTQDVAAGSAHFYVGNSSDPSGTGDADANAEGVDLESVGNSQFESNVANTTNSTTGNRFSHESKYSITSDIASDGSTSHAVVELDPGDTVTVGFAIDLFGQEIDNSNDIISDVTIIADTGLEDETSVEVEIEDESLSEDPESV